MADNGEVTSGRDKQAPKVFENAAYDAEVDGTDVAEVWSCIMFRM